MSQLVSHHLLFSHIDIFLQLHHVLSTSLLLSSPVPSRSLLNNRSKSLKIYKLATEFQQTTLNKVQSQCGSVDRSMDRTFAIDSFTFPRPLYSSREAYQYNHQSPWVLFLLHHYHSHSHFPTHNDFNQKYNQTKIYPQS